MADTTSPQATSAGPGVAGLATTLTAAMAAGTLTQFLIGALGPILIPDLGLSRTQFGAVTASFFVAAALLSPVAGRLCDEWGGQPLVALTFVAAGLGFGTMSLAQSHTGLVLGSLVTGIAGATANPATNLVVAESAPRGEQGTLIGIKQSGVQIGAFTSGFLPAASQVVGWRWVLLACGAVCVAGVGLAIPALRGRTPRATRRAARARASHLALPDRLSRWLVPYAALMGLGGAAVSTYLPLYAVEATGFSVGRAGLLASAIGFVGVPARILWARKSERRERAAGPLALIAFGSAVAVLVMLVAHAWQASALWGAAALFGATGAAWNAVGMLAIIREAGSGSAGRVSGRVLSGFYVGLVLGPIPFGYVVDRTGTYTPGWIAVVLVYLLGAALSLRWRRQPALAAASREPGDRP